MVKELFEKIKKREAIVVAILILISITVFAFNYGFYPLDELWNFSNIYKLLNGYKIYKEVNIIITPLFFFIGELIFKLLGANFFTFKIYNILIFIFFYYLIYYILGSMSISKKSKYLYLILIFAYTFKLISPGANYNILAFCFYMLGVLLLLKNKPSYIQGLIVFLIFLSKQNVGVIYGIGYGIYLLVKYKNIKKVLKEIWKPILIFLILITIFVLYLMINGILYDFINTTMLGLTEFSNKNKSIGESMFRIIFVVIIIGFCLWMYKKELIKFNENEKNRIKVLLCFSIMGLFISYPIINKYHMIISTLLPLMTFIIFCEKGFLYEINNTKYLAIIENIIIILFVIGITATNIYFNYKYIKEMEKSEYNDPYYGAIMSDETKANIDKMIEYINKTKHAGTNVKIISYYADLYMNVLKENNGIMDLPFNGNMGYHGDEALIKEIKGLKNTNILILKEENDIIQESEKARQFIKDSYEKIGEIEMFDIYYAK